MNVPKLRFKEFDGEWEEKDIIHIAQDEKSAVKIGPFGSQLRKEYLQSAGLYKVYGQENVFNNDFSQGNRFLNEERFNLLKSSEIISGDIVISMMGTIGKIAEVPSNIQVGIMDSHLIRIRLDNQKYLNSFFIQVMNSTILKKQIEKLSVGSIMSGLSSKVIKTLQFPYTKIEEQKKISKFLNLLDKKIQLQQQKIDLLQEQKKGYMQKIFNIDLNRELNSNLNFEWKETKVGNIVSSFSGGTPSITNKNYYNGEIPFIRSGELHSHTTELFLSEEGLEKSSAKLVQEGDLLYALYGATSGEVEISKIAGAINQAILCLRPKEDNKYFLRYWLEYKKDYILKTYLQGGQGNLSASIIKSLNIYLPSHERQENIAIFFLQLDERINFEKEKKILLQKQKQGFMQQMFI